MNKFSMFLSRIGEGTKNAFVSVFVGSILSTLIVYLMGLREVIEANEGDGVSTFIFLSMFFFFFVIPSIVPYFVVGFISEVFKLPSWGVVILAVLAIVWHYSIATRYGFNNWDIQDYVLLIINYIPIFIVFLFVSLYERKNIQQPTE